MKTGTRIWLAVAATVPLALLLLVPLSMAAVSFLRDRMHLSCSFLRMGSDDPGEYYCADGIGYIVPGLVLGFWVFVLLLATALAVAVFLPRPVLATRVLAGVGIAGLAFTVLASIVASAGNPSANGIPRNAWATLMLLPSLVLAPASVALLLVMLSSSRLVTRACLWLALALVVAASVVEPSLLFGTAPAALAIAGALLLSHSPLLAPETASSASSSSTAAG